MGIKDFSKVFAHSGEKKLKDLKGKTIAFDGSTELYRAALGMKHINGLTDSSGRPTLHLSVILHNIIAYKKNNINQIWVFDNDETNSSKKLEKTEEEELFSDTDEEDVADREKEAKDLDEKERKLEKQTFRPPAWMFADIKFILDMMGISYIESPKGTEAECVAARLTHKDVELADMVFSQDTDPILFKAKILIRRIKKKYYQYVYRDIVEENDITHTQLIKVAMVMGCDFYKDNRRPKSTQLFRGIGAKTVIKRIRSPNMDAKFLDPEVKSAMKYVKRKIKMSELKWSNRTAEPYQDQKNIKLLLGWLVGKKSFNEKIWTTKLVKAGILNA